MKIRKFNRHNKLEKRGKAMKVHGKNLAKIYETVIKNKEAKS